MDKQAPAKANSFVFKGARAAKGEARTKRKRYAFEDRAALFMLYLYQHILAASIYALAPGC
jgi:hypothetical protein